MTKTPAKSQQPTSKPQRSRKSKQRRDVPDIEESLNRRFQAIGAEDVPEHLNELAGQLDRAIDKVVRKKSH